MMKSLRLTTLGLALLLAADVTRAETPRPNILWITTEDISPDLGCYQDEYAVTPNLDELASEGTLYWNAFSVSGVCAPSRSCIITGMYPTSIGTHHMRCRGVPPSYVKCFPEYLRAAGYYCTNNVKTDYQFEAPFTAWDESSRNAHWRNRPTPDTPFFCVLNITSTHESRIRQPDKAFYQATANIPDAFRHDPAKAILPPYYPDTPVVRNDWARYYDLITAMDRKVAEILDDLAKDGLAEDTIVFFYGDHGRGLPRGKRWIYDSGLRVPLIIRVPDKYLALARPADRLRGNVSRELVSFVDFGVTVLSLAGVPVPDYMQGQPFLGEQAAEPRRYVYGARDRMDEAYDMIRCVRDDRFKYIRNFEPDRPYAQHISYMDEMPTMKEWRRLAAEGKLEGPQKLFFQETKPVEEFYDTASDPHEVVNLADSPDPALRAELLRMRQALKDWMEEIDDLGFVPEPILWEQRRPGGKYDVTAAPSVQVEPAEEDEKLRVSITCPTEGASIGYRVAPGAAEPQDRQAGWRLYHEPLTLSAGARLQTKACRLGYRDSKLVATRVTLTPEESTRGSEPAE